MGFQRNHKMLSDIHKACREPLFAVLQNISHEQLYWKPAPESRSIGEILRHLVRVDMWFLARLGFDPAVRDKKDAKAEEIVDMLKATYQQIDSILSSFTEETELIRKVETKDTIHYNSPASVIMHMSQHYTYHLAQAVYLRRAQDRNWDAPLKGWENSTDVIAQNLWVNN
jgi:uncharacterized damage-inducible protein DinB